MWVQCVTFLTLMGLFYEDCIINILYRRIWRYMKVSKHLSGYVWRMKWHTIPWPSIGTQHKQLCSDSNSCTSRSTRGGRPRGNHPFHCNRSRLLQLLSFFPQNLARDLGRGSHSRKPFAEKKTWAIPLARGQKKSFTAVTMAWTLAAWWSPLMGDIWVGSTANFSKMMMKSN